MESPKKSPDYHQGLVNFKNSVDSLIETLELNILEKGIKECVIVDVPLVNQIFACYISLFQTFATPTAPLFLQKIESLTKGGDQRMLENFEEFFVKGEANWNSFMVRLDTELRVAWSSVYEKDPDSTIENLMVKELHDGEEEIGGKEISLRELAGSSGSPYTWLMYLRYFQ